MKLKGLLIQALYKINPYWDEIPWNRQRDKMLRNKGVLPKRLKVIKPFTPRPVHVVIVPQHGPSDERFGPAKWNIYFEATQRLRELIGENSVSVLDVREDEATEVWQMRLEELVTQTSATHILTHIETDAGNQVLTWNWDQVFIRLLASGWDGALLGVNFDSAFKWIRAKSRRLARMSPQFMAVDLCMPLTGELVKARVEVGPVNMPVSNATLKLVNESIEGITKVHDVSFIGALYPYRVELIKQLRNKGIDVAVNPHRRDTVDDLESSRSNQPSWLDYMRGLASSNITINFSQSSAGPFEQFKTRVIEATLAGTYLLTDDKERTRLFFPEDEFSTFDSLDELPPLLASLLADRAALDVRARKAQIRARELAASDFWNQIDQGLKHRGLPPIFV